MSTVKSVIFFSEERLDGTEGDVGVVRTAGVGTSSGYVGGVFCTSGVGSSSGAVGVGRVLVGVVGVVVTELLFPIDIYCLLFVRYCRNQDVVFAPKPYLVSFFSSISTLIQSNAELSSIMTIVVIKLSSVADSTASDS